MNEFIKIVPINTKWRDLFELDIQDEELRLKVGAFLDFFQCCAFRYTRRDSANVEHDEWFPAQVLLNHLAERKEAVYASQDVRQHERAGIMRNGKFLIKQDNSPHDGSVEIKPCAIAMGEEGPAGITLPPHYFHGAYYTTLNGKIYPVSIDAALTRLLAVVALPSNKKFAESVESVVVTAISADHTRDFNKPIIFYDGTVRNYETLFDRIDEPPQPEQDTPSSLEP